MPYYRLFYHLVWATKDRLPLITVMNRDPIYATIRAKINELGGIVHALNGMPDHVHLVATLPPSVAVSTCIGQIKGSSSHLAARLPSHTTGAPFAWQAEYGVVSVSEAQLPAVLRYVHQQQHHHAANRLNRLLESYS
jgi:putative transposase